MKLIDQYYCPYCSPRYQFNKRSRDGVMICGQCGDQLVKKTLVKPVQVFALIAATAFIAPLIFMVFGSFKQTLNKPRFQITNKPLPMMSETIRPNN